MKYDGSTINSDSMGHAGVIKCNKATNVVSMCPRRLYTVIRVMRTCCVSNAAEPFVTV